MFSHPSDLVTGDGQRVPLYALEFGTEPARVYRTMREAHGALVPVELAPGVPATLVIGYRTGLGILNDPEHFPADPRPWQATVPPDCPVLPVLQWRPIPMRSTGHEHERLRAVVAAALADVDLHAINAVVERNAVPLINAFCSAGAAELVAEYSAPLVFTVVNELLGCPPAISERAADGVAAVLEGSGAHEGNRIFEDAIRQLLQYRRATPGADITSSLLRHGAELSDEELVQQLSVFYGVGSEPVQALIANALRLLLTDHQFGDGVLAGTLSTRDAIDHVLFHDPPLPNNSFTYPRRPVLVDGVWLPADQPVVVSLAGCNQDPEIAGDHTGNRAHLAWSAGPHRCPARSLAYLIAQNAVDQLLDALPELRLAVPHDELRWRPGPLHRTPAELPVTFEPAARLPLP
ncbi:cytochrome P450 [Nocardia harenae]|uniref:cytochrome P450 n=1 Tax=Nocardia harenae TaxID=358707 RepID=UPI000B18CD58|nr:cytochrome P450 [Nocardia harenae]